MLLSSCDSIQVRIHLNSDECECKWWRFCRSLEDLHKWHCIKINQPYRYRCCGTFEAQLFCRFRMSATILCVTIGLFSSVYRLLSFFPFFMYVFCFVHFQALKMYYKNWVFFFWLGMSENLPLVNRRLNQNLCRFAVRPFQCRSEVDHDFLREFWRISITFGEMKSTIPLRFELIWFFCFQSIWN